jgi:hypothetical protein
VKPRADGPQTPPPEIPTVGLCSLLAKPKDYDGKRVRVRAEYHAGFEYSYLDDTSYRRGLGPAPTDLVRLTKPRRE